MKILLSHNFYQQPGGEDRVFNDEAQLLRRHGHDVQTYSAQNNSIDPNNQLALAGRAIWNRQSHRELSRLVHEDRFDIVHFHNTFPLISPSAYYAAASAGAAVVQTLHNYRMLCVNAMLFRDGKPCESCLGKAFAWQGIARGCYRGSRCASAASALVTGVHRALGTWRNAVDLYIAPSEFAKGKFIAGGLPSQTIRVKPNFILDDPGVGSGDGGYALFVGRLSQEKGLHTLLKAWSQLSQPIHLKIAGQGDLKSQISNVEYLGQQTPLETAHLMRRAKFLIAPSECYETFGRVVIEALAAGTPAIVSTGGALAEIISDEFTGLHVRPGDPSDLASKINRMISGAPNLRAAARSAFTARYTADQNYFSLKEIYKAATERRGRRTAINKSAPRIHTDAGSETATTLTD